MGAGPCWAAAQRVLGPRAAAGWGRAGSPPGGPSRLHAWPSGGWSGWDGGCGVGRGDTIPDAAGLPRSSQAEPAPSTLDCRPHAAPPGGRRRQGRRGGAGQHPTSRLSIDPWPNRPAGTDQRRCCPQARGTRAPADAGGPLHLGNVLTAPPAASGAASRSRRGHQAKVAGGSGQRSRPFERFALASDALVCAQSQYRTCYKLPEIRRKFAKADPAKVTFKFLRPGLPGHRGHRF
jgi:hypothetical protein